VTLILKVIILIVVIFVVTIAVLRIRKLRRDEIRELSRPVERRLVTPPPSPYAPSKGFRLLDGPIAEQRRPPTRPRLEADKDYVFSETQMAGDESTVPSQFRHNEKWALSKSARRSASMSGLRVAIIAIVLVLLLGAAGLYLQHHKPTGSTPPTTTTTTKHTTTPTTKHTTTPTTKHATSSAVLGSSSSFTLTSWRAWSHVTI
jgi:hypothetical protein